LLGINKIIVMNLKTILTIITLIVGMGIHAKAQNVFYREMKIKPSVRIEGDLLFVYTSGSMEYAEKNIYYIIVAVDQKSKTVFISANQAKGKLYQTEFLISAKRYNIFKPESFKYYWIDPDRKRIEIDIISEEDARKYSN
jgi:hypothetical protein